MLPAFAPEGMRFLHFWFQTSPGVFALSVQTVYVKSNAASLKLPQVFIALFSVGRLSILSSGLLRGLP